MQKILKTKKNKENNELRIDNKNINLININNKENNVEKNNIIEENNNIDNFQENITNINPLNKNSPINLKFPNLDKHFKLNNQIPVNLNGFKRILSSKYPKSKKKINRPYTANNNKILSPQKDIDQKFRPMTGLKHHSQINDKDNYDIIGRHNKKRPLSQANINLKDITNGTNEFIFNKIFKTLEEAKGIKKLTINDIS